MLEEYFYKNDSREYYYIHILILILFDICYFFRCIL